MNKYTELEQEIFHAKTDNIIDLLEKVDCLRDKFPVRNFSFGTWQKGMEHLCYKVLHESNQRIGITREVHSDWLMGYTDSTIFRQVRGIDNALVDIICEDKTMTPWFIHDDRSLKALKVLGGYCLWDEQVLLDSLGHYSLFLGHDIATDPRFIEAVLKYPAKKHRAVYYNYWGFTHD